MIWLIEDSKIQDGTTDAEASTLGLVPGHWPRQIEYRGSVYDRWRAVRSNDNELLAVRYRSGDLLLTIWND